MNPNEETSIDSFREPSPSPVGSELRHLLRRTTSSASESPALPQPGRHRAPRRIPAWAIAVATCATAILAMQFLTHRTTATGQDSSSVEAAALSAAFLREFLTLDGNPAARGERLAPFLAEPAPSSAWAESRTGWVLWPDLVVPASVDRRPNGFAARIMTHLVSMGPDGYAGAITLRLEVPVVAIGGKLAVAGPPCPMPLLADSGGAGQGRAATAQSAAALLTDRVKAAIPTAETRMLQSTATAAAALVRLESGGFTVACQIAGDRRNGTTLQSVGLSPKLTFPPVRPTAQVGQFQKGEHVEHPPASAAS